MTDRYDLPPVARVLRRLCGVQGLCALVQRWRGQSLYVPTPDRLRPDHPIAQAVGMEAARRLSAECGGNRLTVPLCIGALRAERDREIWRRYMDGVPTSRLARDYGMTWRSIQKVTHRVRMRGGAPEREAEHAAQLSFGWRQNPMPPPAKPHS